MRGRILRNDRCCAPRSVLSKAGIPTRHACPDPADWHQRHAILAGTRIWCFIKCITMNNPDLIRLMPVEGDACPVTKGGRPDFGSN